MKLIVTSNAPPTVETPFAKEDLSLRGGATAHGGIILVDDPTIAIGG